MFPSIGLKGLLGIEHATLQLPTSNFQLPTPNFQLPTPNYSKTHKTVGYKIFELQKSDKLLFLQV